MKTTIEMKYTSRKDLSDAVNYSLKNDSIGEFRRDLDKALEEADRITGSGYFMGRYWAEQAVKNLVAIGCDFKIDLVHDTKPHYSINWLNA